MLSCRSHPTEVHPPRARLPARLVSTTAMSCRIVVRISSTFLHLASTSGLRDKTMSRTVLIAAGSRPQPCSSGRPWPLEPPVAKEASTPRGNTAETFVRTVSQASLCAFRRYGMADMAAKAAAHLTEQLQAEGALVKCIQAEPHREVALRTVLVGYHVIMALLLLDMDLIGPAL